MSNEGLADQLRTDELDGCFVLTVSQLADSRLLSVDASFNMGND